jgi:GcrA cell cycle regulator
MRLWTEEQDTVLARLWAEGHSCSKIALMMTTMGHPARTRNAIIGRCHRSGLATRVTPSKQIKRVNHTAPHAMTAKRIRARVPVDHPMRAAERRLALLDAAPVAPLNIPLDQLEWGMCRAVSLTDDWGLPKYCGHPAHNDTSWCEAHHARVFRPKEPRRRVHYEHSIFQSTRAWVNF